MASGNLEMAWIGLPNQLCRSIKSSTLPPSLPKKGQRIRKRFADICYQIGKFLCVFKSNILKIKSDC